MSPFPWRFLDDDVNFDEVIMRMRMEKDSDKEIAFILQVAVGYAIKLTFIDLDIEYHYRCGYDYVQVLISHNLERLVDTMNIY